MHVARHRTCRGVVSYRPMRPAKVRFRGPVTLTGDKRRSPEVLMACMRAEYGAKAVAL
jgi:hypothetical protein